MQEKSVITPFFVGTDRKSPYNPEEDAGKRKKYAKITFAGSQRRKNMISY
jgi:hypothetical protein